VHQDLFNTIAQSGSHGSWHYRKLTTAVLLPPPRPEATFSADFESTDCANGCLKDDRFGIDVQGLIIRQSEKNIVAHPAEDKREQTIAPGLGSRGLVGCPIGNYGSHAELNRLA
jgi:hypothetical protein